MKTILQTYVRMTQRQQQVIRFVAHGFTNREIAGQLYISKQVVADHLTVIYEELHIVLENCQIRPNRPILIYQFALLFQQYPDLIPDNERRKMRF